MKKVQFPLDQREAAYKSRYPALNKEFFSRPVTLQEYQDTEELHLSYYDQAYREYRSNEQHGSQVNTVKDVDNDSHLYVSRHFRYSLPIMHNHDYIEIVYVYSGTCLHFLNDSFFEMKEGDLCILAPHSTHALSATHDDDVILNIMLSKKLLDDSFFSLLKHGQAIMDFMWEIFYGKQSSPYILFHTGTDQQLSGLFLRMYQEWKQQDYLAGMYIELYIKQMFIQLIRKYEMLAVLPNPVSHAQDANIISIIGYIAVNYATVTLTELADFFGYNESYLGKLIHNYSGKTFRQLVTEMQMKKARDLLLNSDETLTEISERVGCYDSSHFTKKFKTLYGVSPNLYRQQAKEEKKDS